MDYSFICFKDSFTEAKNTGDSPTATHIYQNIQLSPNEAYCQITNVDGGISFMGMYEAHIVDCNNVALQDITENTFIEEFTGIDATQCNIEFVNIGTDYYRKTVFIRLSATDSDLVYWSNPLNITDYQIDKTVYFQYKNADDFNGISYTNSGAWQSIRLQTYFDIPIDSSEITDYYQISRQKTISARALIKEFEQYQLDYIDNFTYRRLNLLLKHELIYIDGIRVTNKTTVESQNREADSNYFISNFQVSKNYNDTLAYEYQVFDGLNYVSFSPSGNYTECTLDSFGVITFNQNITLQTGTVTVYDASDNSLVDTFTDSEMTIVDNTLVITGFNNDITANANYYVNISGGLVSFLGIENEAITDANTWSFSIIDGQYDLTDYEVGDYFTGCVDEPSLTNSLVLFYKFNETSGTVVTDSSGNNYDGTNTNVTINETGVVDKCYLFNSGGATDEFVDLPIEDDLTFGSGAFAIEVWLNPVDLNTSSLIYILNKYISSFEREFRLAYVSSTNSLVFRMYTDSSNYIDVSDNTLVTGSWQQVFITYDGSGVAAGLKMKINNVSSSGAASMVGTFTGMPDISQSIRLGLPTYSDDNSFRYEGYIDILRIWKGYAPTDAEITTLYNSGNGTES